MANTYRELESLNEILFERRVLESSGMRPKMKSVKEA